MNLSTAQIKGVIRLLLACLIAPGLPALATYCFVVRFGIVLPDNFGSEVFLIEAAMFYGASTPVFLTFHLVHTRSILPYILAGMFVTWPFWLLEMGLPSDASVAPLNPQLFLAPTTMGFGLTSGLLFFLIASPRSAASW